MSGWPTLLAAGFWAFGRHGAFALPGLVGGAAILAVDGLAARLRGPRWAPFATLLLAVAWPMLRVSQTTHSEPLACLRLAGGLCLLTDGWTIGAGAEVAGTDRTSVRRRAGGLLLGLPYVMVNWSSVRLMIVMLVVVAAGTVAAALVLRWRSVRLEPRRRRRSRRRGGGGGRRGRRSDRRAAAAGWRWTAPAATPSTACPG
ncbi:hypothetical protein ACQP2P_12645 [Dactylosporangium sp. CA-139114]|uniref:hypothetical protein n=1 Tax=Dactylosporangium sp. CA-139114 TaxID=3239931 RepID=UPI003D997472